MASPGLYGRLRCRPGVAVAVAGMLCCTSRSPLLLETAHSFEGQGAKKRGTRASKLVSDIGCGLSFRPLDEGSSIEPGEDSLQAILTPPNRPKPSEHSDWQVEKSQTDTRCILKQIKTKIQPFHTHSAQYRRRRTNTRRHRSSPVKERVLFWRGGRGEQA